MKITNIALVGTTRPFGITCQTDVDPALIKEYSVSIFGPTGNLFAGPMTIGEANIDLIELKDQPRGTYIIEIIPFGIDDKEGGKIRAEISVSDTGLETLKAITPSAPKPISARPITVASVGIVADVSVAHGTALVAVGLPGTVGIMLSDRSTVSVPVAWTNAGAVYSGTTAGTYSFTGTLTLPANVTNPNGLMARAKVIVAAATAPAVRPTPQPTAPKKPNWKLLWLVIGSAAVAIFMFWLGGHRSGSSSPSAKMPMNNGLAGLFGDPSGGNINIISTNGGNIRVEGTVCLINNYGRPNGPAVGEQYVPYAGPRTPAVGITNIMR